MLVTLVCVILVAIAALLVVASGPLAKTIGSAVGLSDQFVSVYQIAKWPILVLIVMFIVAILYYAAPNAKLRGFEFVTLGGAVAVVVWLVVSALFAFYVANFGSYDKTYGTLGGVVTFLVWLWITNVAILLGNQLNAERERDKELKEGVDGAETEIRLDERDEPKAKKRPTTA
jgi:membrane protein